MRHKTSRDFLLLLSLLAVPVTTPAAGSAASTLMSQAMLSMMDAMGNLAQQYNRNRGWASGNHTQPFYNWQGMQSAPWGMYGMPGGVPGQAQIQDFMEQAPGAASSAQQTLQGLTQQLPGGAHAGQPGSLAAPGGAVPAQSALDGIWQGRDGEIVLVMYGRFRIYADADHYRDGLYQIQDNLLILHDPDSGISRTYEFAYDQGRMVLRDESGRLLLYRQLPIPVPPYSIFSGQTPISAEQQSAADEE